MYKLAMSHWAAFVQYGLAWVARNIRTVAITTATLGVVHIAGSCCYNVLFHPLAKYPGPRLRAATKLPYLAAMWSGYQHRAMEKLHAQYGPVVRIGPTYLSYINPQAWNDIYGRKKSREQEMIKDPEFMVKNPKAPSIINGDHDEHARYRRLFNPGFSARSLREQEPLIQGYVNMFIKGLSRASQNGKTPVDMVLWFNFVTFDIIGDLAFGEPFGCLETGEADWLRSVNQVEEAQVRFRIIQHLPLVGRFARPIVKSMLSSEAIKGQEIHEKATREKVNRRMNNNASRSDFMDHILSQPKGEGLTFSEMLTNAETIIQAGSETTANLLAGALYLLNLNPDKMQKLVDELLTSFESPDMITIESTERLTYLPAVLEESLRVYSPSVGGFPRQVPKGGAIVDGQYVPGGTSVIIPHHAAYHSPLNFSRPDDFIPERFIDTAAFPDDRRDVLQPFSVGPRNCIGKSLAYAEGRVILARALWHYDMQLTEESQDWGQDLKGYVTWIRPPMEVYVRPRHG